MSASIRVVAPAFDTARNSHAPEIPWVLDEGCLVRVPSYHPPLFSVTYRFPLCSQMLTAVALASPIDPLNIDKLPTAIPLICTSQAPDRQSAPEMLVAVPVAATP